MDKKLILIQEVKRLEQIALRREQVLKAEQKDRNSGNNVAEFEEVDEIYFKALQAKLAILKPNSWKLKFIKYINIISISLLFDNRAFFFFFFFLLILAFYRPFHGQFRYFLSVRYNSLANRLFLQLFYWSPQFAIARSSVFLPNGSLILGNLKEAPGCWNRKHFFPKIYLLLADFSA